MDNSATKILYNRIISDQMYAAEIQTLLKTTSSIEDKASAVRHYCDRNFYRGLGSQTEKQVVKNVMEKTSWTRLAEELDTKVYHH